MTLSISRKREAGSNVLVGQIRELTQNFCLGHSAGQILEDILHRHTKAANAGLAASFSGFNSDNAAVVHNLIIPNYWAGVKIFGVW